MGLKTVCLNQCTLCPQKSEPPKHFETAAANLHRFKLNFTHTRRHLFLSSTSNFLFRLRDVQFFQTAGVKINGSYYRHAVETTVAASHSFSLWWLLHLPARQCPAHRARETVALLSAETPDFISPMDWPPNRVEHFDCSGWHELRWKLMTCGWCYLKFIFQ